MPEGASQAVPLLERALLLEPNYALAHGQTAFCNEILYLRAGRREDNRRAAIQHAHIAVALGPDDAPALVYAAIAIGLVEHVPWHRRRSRPLLQFPRRQRGHILGVR